MQMPLEIAFHHIERSEQAENEIRTHVADLEKIYERLVSCRVRIDQRARDVSGTIPPVVRIGARRNRGQPRARSPLAKVQAPRPA